MASIVQSCPVISSLWHAKSLRPQLPVGVIPRRKFVLTQATQQRPWVTPPPSKTCSQAEKLYVQDRVRQAGGRVWELLQGGAHFYVCGDAGGMAPAVQEALLDVVQQHQVPFPSRVFMSAFRSSQPQTVPARQPPATDSHHALNRVGECRLWFIASAAGVLTAWHVV